MSPRVQYYYDLYLCDLLTCYVLHDTVYRLSWDYNSESKCAFVVTSLCFLFVVYYVSCYYCIYEHVLKYLCQSVNDNIVLMS